MSQASRQCSSRHQVQRRFIVAEPTTPVAVVGKRRKAQVLDSGDENDLEATVKLEPAAKRARTVSVSDANSEDDEVRGSIYLL